MQGKRSIYNLVMGLLSQIVTLVTAVLVPRLILVNLGSEANGLLNSVNQALVYLALMEAGVGTVTIQALYRPVAENDRKGICAVLAATRKFYRRTGTFYVLAMGLFCLVYPLVVETSLPRTTVVQVILFSGGTSVLNYFFHGKYTMLLNAEGKQYLISIMSMSVHVLSNAAKIILLLRGFDVVAVQMAYFFTIAAQSAFICLYIRKKYKWLDLNVEPDDQAISQRNSVLIHQISGLIFGNTDNLLLSMSWGLKYVSVYSVFMLVFAQLGNLVSVLTNSLMFILGQNYQTDREKFDRDYDLFELGSFVVTFLLSSVCAVMITPFIRLYTDGVTDVDYLNFWYPVLFTAMFLLSNLRAPAQTAITVAGHFKKTTKQSILESGINLLVSLILLPKYGIIGVLAGTITALLYRTNDMILYSAKHVHSQKKGKTYGRILRNAAVFLAFGWFGFRTPPQCDHWLAFIGWGAGLTLAAAVAFLGVNALFERELARQLLQKIKTRKNG